MTTGYHRVELDLCLDIDEVAECMMYASDGLMIDFEPDKAKETDGKVDEVGTHYSPHD